MVVTLFTTLIATAQSRVITGTVKDDKGEFVPFASIIIKGTKNGVAADAAGSFKVNAKTGDVLVISAVGYSTIEVSITAAVTGLVEPVLKKVDNVTEVVVTTTLGQQVKTKNLGYQIAQIKGTELTQAKTVNLANGLTAKVSGLNVLTTNNSVFADTRITLRGIRSLTGNNQPMLILDGTPIALSYITSINPNDIADVSVLKSTSSTAIYGPEGANGAIVITTKKGSKSKPSISFSNTTQFESISYMPKFQTQYGSGYYKDADGNGIYDQAEQQSWGDPFDGSIRQLGETGPNGEKLMVPYSYNKNGRRNFFQTGITNQTDISYSTGDFYISAQNVKISGVLKGDENNRRVFTLKSEKEYGKFKAGFNVRYINTAYNVTTSNRLVYYGVTGAPGQIDLGMFENWKNDYFSSPDGYYTTYLGNNGKTPYFAKDNNREIGRTDEILANAQLDFKPTPWLNFTYRVGTTLASNDYRRTRGAFTHSAFYVTRPSGPTANNITSSVTDANSLSSRLNSEFFADMKKKFADFDFGLTLGHSYRETRSKSVLAGSDNLGTSEFLSIVARKGEPNVGVTNSKTKLERFFGKLTINYNGWANIEATGSYDRDSRLSDPLGQFTMSDIGFFYPGVSGSILLSEVVPAFKNSKVLNFFKLRGAVSKTGNVNLSPYGLETRFTNGLFFPYGSVSGYLSGATTVAKRYDPEFIINKEVGLELKFLKKIGLDVTYYTQDNSNQIIDVQLSNSTGFTTATQNAGAFTNSGLEFDLKLTPLVKIKNVIIDLNVNYTYQTSKMTKLVGDVKELGIGNFNYAILGQPAFVFKLTDYIRDPQGRVIVGSDGMPTINPNLTTFGRTQPTDILGLNLSVNWKDLTFSAVAEYRGGNQMVSDDLGTFMDDNGISERSGQYGRRAFIFPNSSIETSPGKFEPNTSLYTQSYGREFWNSSLNTDVQTNYLSSGAFWKIREVAINYNVPQKVYKWKAIKGLTIGVSGRNLFMFLPKSNQWTDPEFSSTGTTATLGNPTGANIGNSQGRNTANNLPPTRIFGASVNVLF